MTIETVTMTRTVITGCNHQHILRAGTTADLKLGQAIDFCLHGYCVPACDNLPVTPPAGSACTGSRSFLRERA